MTGMTRDDWMTRDDRGRLPMSGMTRMTKGD